MSERLTLTRTPERPEMFSRPADPENGVAQIENLLLIPLTLEGELSGCEIDYASGQGYVKGYENLSSGFVDKHNEAEGVYELYFLLDGEVDVTRGETTETFSAALDLIAHHKSTYSISQNAEGVFQLTITPIDGNNPIVRDAIVIEPGVTHATTGKGFSRLIALKIHRSSQ